MINDTVVEAKSVKTNATYWRNKRGCHGLDRMIDGFTTTCVSSSAYHHKSCELTSRSWWGVLDATLCGKVRLWLAAGWWFSPGTPVSSTNKTDCSNSWNIVESCAKHHQTKS